MSNTVLLIHGAWLNSRSWDAVKQRYEARGFSVVAPDWPYDDRSPAELRELPDAKLASLGIAEILAHYDRVIGECPEEPILIGHSAGGVFVQHLLDRGLGVAGVAIDPAPTPGVALGPHAIVSALPIFFDWGSWKKAETMSRSYFQSRFAQLLSKEESDAAYDRFIVPTPGKIWWDGIVNKTPIRWDNPERAPLLLIGGELDLVADASMTQAIFEKQRQAPSRTEIKVFAGRSHWTLLEPGWEDVADFALDWAVRNARAPKAIRSTNMSTSDKVSVVLVHGGFVDGSGWQGVHRILKEDGYDVTVVQNPTTSLAEDVAVTRRAIAAAKNPVVLVGHSYGGAVISEAGNDPKVRSLAYIAAFAPDQGESVETLISTPVPDAPAPPILPAEDGFFKLDSGKFAEAFASDIDRETAQFMADAQVPWGVEALTGKVSDPAWKSKPTFYLVATDDRMIPPPAQRQMAERAGAKIVEAEGSHAIYVSKPQAVAELIERAASLTA